MKNLFNGIYKNRKVLVTGHTGFKGSWLCILLNKLGAEIYGYALDPPTNPSLYEGAKINEFVTSLNADIQDYAKLSEFIQQIQPEIVIHLAAQALVRESYINPRETYSINVMGTVNLLEACRPVKSIKAIVNVTTDKCYHNQEWSWGYRENDILGGYDPYSNSKSCSELITSSYRDSFFGYKNHNYSGIALASARAGNVIGGGDWAKDRLIPDFIRAISKGEKLELRNPLAVRPWQHVLEPLNGYLLLASKLYTEGFKYAQSWNFGPDDNDLKNVEWITRTICHLWGNGAFYSIDHNLHPHESNYLKLDCSKAKNELGWYPKWDIKKALESVISWNKSILSAESMLEVTEKQILNFFESN